MSLRFSSCGAPTVPVFHIAYKRSVKEEDSTNRGRELPRAFQDHGKEESQLPAPRRGNRRPKYPPRSQTAVVARFLSLSGSIAGNAKGKRSLPSLEPRSKRCQPMGKPEDQQKRKQTTEDVGTILKGACFVLGGSCSISPKSAMATSAFRLSNTFSA